MKNKDIIIRGGHLLKYVDGDLWEFVPAWKDAPIYLTFNEAKTDIIALDCSNMGMPLLVGCESSLQLQGGYCVQGRGKTRFIRPWTGPWNVQS